MLMSLDADGDGGVSEEEFVVGFMEWKKEREEEERLEQGTGWTATTFVTPEKREKMEAQRQARRKEIEAKLEIRKQNLTLVKEITDEAAAYAEKTKQQQKAVNALFRTKDAVAWSEMVQEERRQHKRRQEITKKRNAELAASADKAKTRAAAEAAQKKREADAQVQDWVGLLLGENKPDWMKKQEEAATLEAAAAPSTEEADAVSEEPPSDFVDSGKHPKEICDPFGQVDETKLLTEIERLKTRLRTLRRELNPPPEEPAAIAAILDEAEEADGGEHPRTEEGREPDVDETVVFAAMDPDEVQARDAPSLPPTLLGARF